MAFIGVTVAVGAQTSLPAFPGAEGFGAVSSGGRGGQVLIVTNLNDGGTGSLQWALDQTGPRIIVFEVSGVIDGDIEIPHGDVTIAGQTAPGAGLTIDGHLTTPYGDEFGNIIIRHLRVRPPDPDSQWPPNQHDAIQFSTVHTIMLDHMDLARGADENIDTWGGASIITVQHSIIAFAIHDPGNDWDHPKGIINHRPCLDSGNCDSNDPTGGFFSLHHNLFAHVRNRTPAASVGPTDVRNNVIYNVREGFVHHNHVDGDFNIIGNWYIDGPSASLVPFWFDPENGTASIPTRYWVWDNWVEHPGTFTGRVDNPFTTTGFDTYSFYCCGIEASQFNNWGEFDFSSHTEYVPITTEIGDQTYELVLDVAGAWPRDVLSAQVIADVESRGGGWTNFKTTDWMVGLTPGIPPADIDRDGMADGWEQKNGFSPFDGTDHTTVMPSGYTAIEDYINMLADNLVSRSIFNDDFESGSTGAWSATAP